MGPAFQNEATRGVGGCVVQIWWYIASIKCSNGIKGRGGRARALIRIRAECPGAPKGRKSASLALPSPSFLSRRTSVTSHCKSAASAIHFRSSSVLTPFNHVSCLPLMKAGHSYLDCLLTMESVVYEVVFKLDDSFKTPEECLT